MTLVSSAGAVHMRDFLEFPKLARQKGKKKTWSLYLKFVSSHKYFVVVVCC